jgi:putative ABC transport system ATP-binding protein
VLDEFRRLRADFGATVVVVTHSPAVAASADRVVEIRDGRVVV